MKKHKTEKSYVYFPQFTEGRIKVLKLNKLEYQKLSWDLF